MKNFFTTLFSDRNNLFMILGILALWQLFSHLDIFERLYEASRVYETVEADDLLLTLLVSPIVLMVGMYLKNKNIGRTKLKFCCEDIDTKDITNSTDKDAKKLNQNWILEAHEAEHLVHILGRARMDKGFNEDEINLVLNWANNVRHNEQILNLVQKEVIEIDVDNEEIIFYKK